MRNKASFIGLSLSILFVLAIFGFEVYINGRPDTFDYCNGGDYPYSNWYYEYGDFAWQNVDWSKIFGSARVYIELLLLIPFFIYFTSKIKGRPNGSYRSLWLKVIMAISSVPLIIIFLSFITRSQSFVIDYDTDCDPVAVDIMYIFVFTLLGYYLNMLSWMIVYIVKKIAFVKKNRDK